MNTFHQLKVLRKIIETPDAVSLVLDIPTELKAQYQYTPGQFVKLQVQVNNETLARSYSIASCPGWDDEFKITVKKVPHGRVSSFLVDTLKQHDLLLVRPPRGKFILPTPTPKEVIFVAAGSGITPIMSMLKQTLLKGHKATLLYANRNEQNIIYHNELHNLSQNTCPQLKNLNPPPHIQHHLSQHQGRLTTQQLNTFFHQHDPHSQAHYFFCGPRPLMQNAQEILKPRIPKTSLHQESFGGALRASLSRDGGTGGAESTSRGLNLGGSTSVSRNENLDGAGSASRGLDAGGAGSVSHKGDKGDTGSASRGLDVGGAGDEGPNPSKPQVHIGPGPYKPQAAQVCVQLDGENKIVQCQEGESILEALLREGHNAPYSCTEGACMACMGTVTKGQVHQSDIGVLADENIQQAECLTCQARPLSNEVHIKYEF